MIKRLRPYGAEIGAVALLGVMSCTVTYWVRNHPKASFVRFLLSVVLAVSGILLYRLLRRLWRSKWRRSLIKATRFLLSRASGFLFKLLERWRPMRNQRTELGGRTTVSFDFSVLERIEKKPQKPKKWRQLASDRERLGYLYGHMLDQKIRRGFRAYSFETPLELRQKGEHEAEELRLFDLYADLRYDERREPSADILQQMKEELDIK